MTSGIVYAKKKAVLVIQGRQEGINVGYQKKKKASRQSDNLSVKRDWGIRSWKRKKERRWKGGDPRTLVVAEGTGSEN